MDRLDAMKVFVLAVDEGSLAAAGRKLGRSPAAVSRAIAFLEERVGAELLHRTTRSIKLSEEGERYVAICRRVEVTRSGKSPPKLQGPKPTPRCGSTNRSKRMSQIRPRERARQVRSTVSNFMGRLTVAAFRLRRP